VAGMSLVIAQVMLLGGFFAAVALAFVGEMSE
jgi:hypothetical protein